MTSRDFCYWLQGLFEVGKVTSLDEEQVAMIKSHLNLVFYHEIDPSQHKTKEAQKIMQEIHDEGKVHVPHPTPPYHNHGSVRC